MNPLRQMINCMNLVWAYSFKPVSETAKAGAAALDISAFQQVCTHASHLTPAHHCPLTTLALFKGVVVAPKPFECRITPRSEEHAAVIHREFREVIPFFAPYEERLDKDDKNWLMIRRLEGSADF
jgi:hypothetical protein